MDQAAAIISQQLTAWEQQNERVNKLIETIDTDALAAETAPGRNSGIYLLGHLAAVNDGMLPLLGLGEKMYPELEDIFLKSPDKSGKAKPDLETIKRHWKAINTALTAKLRALTPAEWMQRHTAVTEADFAKEPHRNRLNILISRTVHQAYHLGQLMYLAK